MDVYEKAFNARVIAEEQQDPELFRLAAALFQAVGMEASATAMMRRAEHYEKGECHERSV